MPEDAPTPTPASPASSRCRAVAGRILRRAGLLSLPVAAGAAAGYWAADLGLAWLPDMLELLLAAVAFGLLAVPAGTWLCARSGVPVTGSRRLGLLWTLCLVLAALAIAGRLAVHAVQTPSALTSLLEREYNRLFETDVSRLADCERGLEQAVACLEGRADMFPPSGNGPQLGADQERDLLATWRSAYDCAFALDQVRLFHEDWYRFDPSRAGRSRHLRSFLLTFAAELALFEKSSRLVRLLDRNAGAVKFLNAPHGELEADSFSRFRRELQGSRDLARVVAGRGYLRWMAAALGAREEAEALGCAGLWRRIEERLAAIEALAGGKLAAASAGSDIEVLRRGVRRAWFPRQSAVAEWMGDTRVRRHGVYLIAAEQLAVMRGKLEPGDVLLCRKNWYLSNVALPGFWPHAALYVGTPAELDAFFDVPEVREHLRKLAGREISFSEYVAMRWPARAAEHRSPQDGKPRRVIEAISEGVSLNSLETAAGDYLAALRPRLGRMARAQAILEAFGHLGKPYDFDFDFATDHALVCTEVVWRSYRPAEGKEGLRLATVEVMGRQTLPANEIARTYAAERGTPAARFDFVYYLAGREKKRCAVPATEEEFGRTPELPKWDILQE